MKKIVCIILGNILLAFGLSAFLLDHNVLLGGVSGLSTVFHAVLPSLSTDTYVYLLTIGLFVLGFLCFGKDFATKTLISSLLFPVLFSFFNRTFFFHPMVEDIFFASVAGGSLVGAGVACILSSDGSSGGLDILALLLHKKTGFPLSYSVNGIDFLVIVLQMPFHTKQEILYGLCSIAVSTLIMHYLLLQGTRLVQLTIITSTPESIESILLQNNDAGITVLKARQGYTKKDTEVILCALPIHKLAKAKQNILSIDPHAFIIQQEVTGIQGYRFTY